MNEPCKIDIKGPAHLIVPISESLDDKYMFNDLVDHYIGHNVSTQEELDIIIKKVDEFIKCVMKHFTMEMLSGDREVLRAFHKKVIAKMGEENNAY